MAMGPMVFLVNLFAGQTMNSAPPIFQRIKASFPEAEIVLVKKKDFNFDQEVGERQRMGVKVFVGFGGDGTLNRIANSLDRSDPEVVLGVIPAGTANDIAAGLNIPSNFDQALEVIKKGRTRSIDIGQVNDQIFLSTLSFGTDAEINKLALEIKPNFQKIRAPRAAYVAAAAAMMIRKERFWSLKIKADGREIDSRGLSFLTITNFARYGSIFYLHPGARPDDGRLNACLMRQTPNWQLPLAVFEVISQMHLKDPGRFSFLTFREMIIESKDKLEGQVDGSPVVLEPKAKVSVKPKMLSVLAPVESQSVGCSSDGK